MSVNLKELSAHLKLSPTTVSRALAGYDDVSPVTRERVQAAAREFGYRPNRAARQVAMGRADAIGIVYSLATDYMGNAAFLETLEGLADSLRQDDIDLLIIAAPRGDELPIYERLQRDRRVDALVVAQTRVEDPRIDLLLESGMPFVAYGRTGRPDAYAWLDFDNEENGRIAASRLIEIGHKRIAYVHASLEFNFAFQRHAGFVGALRAGGIQPDPEIFLGGIVGRRSGYRAGQRLLAMKRRPTAIVVDNVTAGIGMIRALLDAGVAIGSEISLLIGEGMPADMLFDRLGLATIVQPTDYSTGTTIGQMLKTLVAGQPLAQPHVLRQPQFVDGSSIGPPPTGE